MSVDPGGQGRGEMARAPQGSTTPGPSFPDNRVQEASGSPQNPSPPPLWPQSSGAGPSREAGSITVASPGLRSAG